MRPIERCRGCGVVALVVVVLAIAAEFGHMQWTSGGPSGVRGRGVPFDANGVARWRESGVSLARGAIGVWTSARSVAKDSYDWGGGGALFFGINSELGGPSASRWAVRWLPLAGSGVVPGGVAADRTMYVMLPLWPIAALLLIGFVIAYRRASLGPSACRACGYDVGGLGDRPCPECGAKGTGPV